MTVTFEVFESANWNPIAKKSKDKQTPNKHPSNKTLQPIRSTRKNPIKVHRKLTEATTAAIHIA